MWMVGRLGVGGGVRCRLEAGGGRACTVGPECKAGNQLATHCHRAYCLSSVTSPALSQRPSRWPATHVV